MTDRVTYEDNSSSSPQPSSRTIIKLNTIFINLKIINI